MKILLTAFAPFGGEDINSTAELIELIPDKIGDNTITKAELPVVFKGSGKVLSNLLEKAQYDAVICLGQNSKADKLNVERVAINVMDARIDDNAGDKPEDEPIVGGAPAAYFATLPIKKMVSASLAAGTPAQVSNSAGTFVCNSTMYHALHITQNGKTKAGFVHVPQTPAQSKSNSNPSMDTATAAKGIAAIIKSL